ncbi:FUSC family protein [Streptomyces sp. NPDC048604]|uniref:FUSC family protein n=1 Tax=Streptomyces sp. NPDC048604 TaxID=3365578 RepID=UPI003722E919
MAGVPKAPSGPETPRASRPAVPAGYRRAARGAVRVTAAAGGGFYLFLYGSDSVTAATYALFAPIALGGLSRIPGTGRQRAAVMLRAAPWSWALITLGTFLAVRTWSAVVGMLVVGFALAFLAVCGPRPAGAAPGLQLLYILPCFPPYDPGSLGERLGGAAVGLGLLILAEAFLFPEPAAPSYAERVAAAAGLAGRCARALGAPPYALTAEDARAAHAAAQSLRPSQVPEQARPAGPGLRDRALAHAGLAARAVLSRLAQLGPPPPGSRPAGPDVPDVLDAVARVTEQTALRLTDRRTGKPGGAQADGRTDAPGRWHEELGRVRTELVAEPNPASGAGAAPALRRRASLLAVVDATLALSMAASLAVRGRAAGAVASPGRFWYASKRAPELWWHRLAGNVGQRSVHFQNAVRISLALAAARLIAGVDTLPHGFWALLATLTLTRTTVTETRVTVRQALTGTLCGAVVAAGLLIAAGSDTTVYAVIMPFVMLCAFTVGPVKGVGWAQALFTVVVSLAFAQLAHSTWQLAEFRILEVLAGSAIGAVFGLLAWPRGAHDELRRSGAALVRATAEIVVATVAAVVAGGVREPRATAPGHRSLQHNLILAESAFAQFQSEPDGAGHGGGPAQAGAGPAAEPDWQAGLMMGHHTLWGSDRLLVPPPPPAGPDGPTVAPPLGREAAAGLLRLGDRVAGRMLLVSAAADPGGDTPETPVQLRDPAVASFEAEPADASPAYYVAVSWLDGLVSDLERITGGGRGGDAT